MDTAAGRAKKAKADAAQSARQVDAREKEQERVKARVEAAGRREQRAGRRRAEDDLAEDTPKPSTSTKTSPPPSSQPTSPPPHSGTEKISHKKGAGKKVKKLGNNQYTNKNKDAANQGAASSPHGKRRGIGNNQAGSSGDEQLANGDSHHSNSANATNKNSPDHGIGPKGKFGKGKNKAVNGNGGKHEEPAELTLLAMKRRMEAMTNFITRAQLEIAGDRTPSGSDVPKVAADNASLAGMVGGAVQPPNIETLESLAGLGDGKTFEDMSAMEMADVVSRSITNWHTQFAHLA